MSVMEKMGGMKVTEDIKGKIVAAAEKLAFNTFRLGHETEFIKSTNLAEAFQKNIISAYREKHPGAKASKNGNAKAKAYLDRVNWEDPETYIMGMACMIAHDSFRVTDAVEWYLSDKKHIEIAQQKYAQIGDPESRALGCIYIRPATLGK